MEQWAVITLVVICVNYSVLLHNVGTPPIYPEAMYIKPRGNVY